MLATLSVVKFQMSLSKNITSTETCTMDDLFTQYQTQLTGNDEFKLFQVFFDSDLRLIQEWIKYRFKKEGNVKCDNQSEALRKRGNEMYGQKQWDRSIEYYTRALCKAKYNGEIYGLALANRSAVFFTLKDYNSCLKDIELCKKTKYPNKLRSKIYIRQLESYYELGLLSEFEKSVQDTLNFLETTEHINHVEKEKCKKKIGTINKTLPKNIEKNIENSSAVPPLKAGKNENFTCASNLIRLSYNSIKGRHVTSKQTLKRGDVIFVEKAFMFAPVYTGNYEMSLKICYHCLSDLISCIPCKTCTVCLYCDENCRDASWNESHSWECKGVTVNLWYDLGIALPAFRALLKGVDCGFKLLTYEDENDTKKFGDETDNYPFFNKLVTNIAKMNNVTPLLVSSAVVIIYLEKQTNFFNWLIQQPNIQLQEMNDLMIFVGGLLTRHIAQLSCNSSIIQHWNTKANEAIPSERIQVACGIYPSISMMNHSCKPNVAMFFIKDILVVKALDTILEGEELFNCYGVDYRYMNKPDRQHALKTLYDFTCTCEICQNPSLEFNSFDSYKCPKCEASLSEILCKEYHCITCGCKKPSLYFQNLEKQARQYIESDRNKIENVSKCYQIRRKILGNYHADLDECFDLFYLYYLKNGDLYNCLSSFKQLLSIQQKRLGKNSRIVGVKMFDTLSSVISKIKEMELSNLLKLRHIVEEFEVLLAETKQILYLYYTSYQVDFSEIEKNIFHIKQLISSRS